MRKVPSISGYDPLQVPVIDWSPVTGTDHGFVTCYRYRSLICHRLQEPITDLSPVTGTDH